MNQGSHVKIYLPAFCMKKDTVRKIFCEQENVLSVIAEGQQQSKVNEVPVKALWNV